METLTNAASSVVNTASNLIYGQPAKENETTATTTGNETAGKEPLSGEQGKGTATEPFDQGNKENQVDATSTPGNTSYKQDDFLKLDPAAGEPTKSFSENKTGATGESSMPIIPLNPDAASMGAGKTETAAPSTTGVTDKTGVSDTLWKPTALDEVKPEGAPGAGPAPPASVTPAIPDLSSSTSNKTEESTIKDTAKETTKNTTKDTTSSEATKDDSTPKKESSGPPASTEPPKEHSVGGDIDKILESTPKSQHTVNDNEASDPHSKMTGKTVRQTDASQKGETPNTKSLATEKAGDSKRSESHDSGEAGEEKSGKMSELKDKLKHKLHIGSKDK